MMEGEGCSPEKNLNLQGIRGMTDGGGRSLKDLIPCSNLIDV